MTIRTTSSSLIGAPLVLIDLQRAIDHPDWGVRNNPDAEVKLSEILAVWRRQGWPVIHIKHDSDQPRSHYRPGQIGHDFKPEVQPTANERVISKTTNSAFIGTKLQNTLAELETKTLVMAGVKTNNSIETTVRHGGNLGFDIHLIEDACFTFAQTDWNGTHHSAEDVHALSLSNLNGEYCRITTMKELLSDVA